MSMTLAGNMKLRTFLVIAVLVVAGGITGSYVMCSGSSHDVAPKPLLTEASPAPVIHVVDAAPPPDAPPAIASDLAARPYDADVIAWRTKTLAKGKGKDVSKGRPWKLNVYADDGTTVNRAKVDANRNNKFDDKYTFKGDQIVLEHAPNDDEHYTESYVWNGTGWTKR
jgi:hypothetical protein